VKEQIPHGGEPQLLESLRLSRTNTRDPVQRQVKVERHMGRGHD
jgi:hypothetical protein